MNESQTVKFGIFEYFTQSFGTGGITSIFSLNYRECLISTTKEIIKIERNIVKMKHPFKFSTCLVVPDTEFLVGVTTQFGDIYIYQMSDLNHPLLERFQTNHSGVFHIFYSQKSNLLITVGLGIKVFKFVYTISRISVVKPTVSLSLHAEFAPEYNTTIIIPPYFDEENDLILLPTSNGICPYTLDGKKLDSLSRFPASLTTVYALQKKSKKLLTFDSDNGMTLWSSFPPQLIQQFPTAGSILAIIFIDSENAVCLNSHLALFYLNIKTGRTFYCVTLEKRPHRLFLIYLDNIPILCLCFHSLLRAMKLIIPWSVWNLNIDSALQMSRCNKYCDAARVLIETNNSFIKLYSPRDNAKITVATPSYAVHPFSYLYDRGIVEQLTFDEENCLYITNVLQTTTASGNKRDVLFIILEDGTIIGYDTGDALCQENMLIPGKAAFMAICYLDNKWCYAVSSKQSDLYIYDYNTLKQIRHFTVLDDFLIKMFYHLESGCIVMVFKKKTILFDMAKGQIIDTVRIKGNRVTAFFADFMTYGYKSGHLTHVKINNKQFVTQCKPENMQRPHSASVSGFSFSQQTWLSSSLDGSVIVWDYNFEKVCQVILPLPIHSCLLMNGKRDLLVATETEVMRIKCNVAFKEGEFDDEITEIDNFDRLNDVLYKEPIITDDNLSLLNDIFSSNDDKSKNDKKSKKSAKKDRDLTFSVKSLTPVINNLSNSADQSNSNKVTRPTNPEEETEESMQKKFEMMQAMDGFSGPIPGMTIPSLGNNPTGNDNNSNKNTNNDNNNKNDDKSDKETDDDKKKAKDEKEKETEKRKKRPQRDEKSLTDFINESMDQEKQSAKRKKVKKQKVNSTPVDDKREQFSEEKTKGLMDNLFGNKKPAVQPNSVKKETGKGINFDALAKQFHKDEDPLILKATDKMQHYNKNNKNNNDSNDTDNEKNNNENNDDKDNIDDKDNDDNLFSIRDNKQNRGNNRNTAKISNNKKSAQSDSTTTTTNAPNSAHSNAPNSNHDEKPKDKQNQKKDTHAKPKKVRKPAKSKTNGSSKANSNKTIESKGKENSSLNPTNNNSVNKNMINAPNSSQNTDSNIKSNENGAPISNFNNNDNCNDNNNDNCNDNNNDNCNDSFLNADSANDSLSKHKNQKDGNDNDNSNDQMKGGSNRAIGSKADNNAGSVGSDVYDPNRTKSNKNVEKIDISIQTDASYLLGDFVPDKDINDDENGLNLPHLPSSLSDAKSPRNAKNKNNDTNTKEIKMNGPYPTSYLSSDLKHHNEDDDNISSVNSDNMNDDYINKKGIRNHNILKGEFEGQINNNEEIKDQRPRCPTPPPIRWNRVRTVKQQNSKRARTPPMKKYPSPRYKDPPPNIVIDREAVLFLYGRGRIDLQPLVDRIEKEKAYKSYIHLSFEHVMKQKIDFSRSLTSRTRFKNRDMLHSKPVDDLDEIYIDVAEQKRMMGSSSPFKIKSDGYYFQNRYEFNSDQNRFDVNSDQNAQKEEASLPKMLEMQYARPMNLISSQKKQQNRSIVLPNNIPPNSPNSARRSVRSERNAATHQEQRPANYAPDENIDSLTNYNNVNDDNNVINLNMKPNSVRSNFDNDKDDSLNEIFSSSSRKNAKSARGAPFKKTWTITMPTPKMLAMAGSGIQHSSDSGEVGNKVDLLAAAVMSKMPKLGIAKRAKSVRTARNGAAGFSSTFSKAEILPKIIATPTNSLTMVGWQNPTQERKFPLENTVPLGNVLIHMK